VECARGTLAHFGTVQSRVCYTVCNVRIAYIYITSYEGLPFVEFGYTRVRPPAHALDVFAFASSTTTQGAGGGSCG